MRNTSELLEISSRTSCKLIYFFYKNKLVYCILHERRCIVGTLKSHLQERHVWKYRFTLLCECRTKCWTRNRNNKMGVSCYTIILNGDLESFSFADEIKFYISRNCCLTRTRKKMLKIYYTKWKTIKRKRESKYYMEYKVKELFENICAKDQKFSFIKKRTLYMEHKMKGLNTPIEYVNKSVA